MVDDQNNNQIKSKNHRSIAVIFALLLILAGSVLIYRLAQKVISKDSPPQNFGNAIVAKDPYKLPPSKPKSIKIDSIGVSANTSELDLNPDKTLQTPSDYEKVGWYIHSPTPGEIGPSVMVGHLDSARAAAVFYKLKNIKAGDKIEISREDGSIATFKVDALETFSQDNFPTDKVYGPINNAGLRLITCAGKYNIFEGHYSDNLVVFASLIKF
jgi:hypothetical protein